MKEMVSVESVATELGTTKLNILMHLKKGILTGEERDGVWLVTSESVEEYKLSHPGERADSLCTSGCKKASACSGGCS